MEHGSIKTSGESIPYQYTLSTYSAANRLLYFKYNQCADLPGNPFAAFSAALLRILDTNPVDTELMSFFQNCRDGKRPRADIEVGMADAMAVMLSNKAMDENRRVYFTEIDKMGKGAAAKV